MTRGLWGFACSLFFHCFSRLFFCYFCYLCSLLFICLMPVYLSHVYLFFCLSFQLFVCVIYFCFFSFLILQSNMTSLIASMLLFSIWLIFYWFFHSCSVWEKKWRRLHSNRWFMISTARSWWVSALNLATSRPSPAFSLCSHSSPMLCWGCWDIAHHRAS